MKITAKIGLVSASVCAMLALSACQSTQPTHERDRHAMKMHEKNKNLTPEQRQQRQEMHEQRQQFVQAINTACDQKKSGDQVALTIGERSIQGQCKIQFYPDRPTKKDAPREARPELRAQTDVKQAPRRQANAVMTDAERAELVKQYDLHLQQRQARQNAIAQACQGKNHGQAVEIKIGEQQMQGKCLVKFRATAPATAQA